MRFKVGAWTAGAGFAVAGLAAVPANLGSPVVAWILFIGGLLIGVAGLVHALRGETPEERRKREHERTVTRNALESERDRLRGRLLQVEGELGKQDYWRGVATSYGDAKRLAVISGDVAALEAERSEVERRLAQIEAELATA